MAKKKQPIEEIKVEDTVVESVEATEEKKAEDDFAERFIVAQLKAINEMPNRAKARRLAERVLSNRKG